MYDVNDWYWLADDGRVFSSARQQVVTAADVAFLMWKAKPASPTPWPRDASGAQTVAALQAVLSEHDLFADLEAYASALRYEKEVGGVVVNGVTIPSDRDTQAKLTAAALLATLDGTSTFNWKLADGSFTSALTAAQMLTIATAVGSHVNRCFVVESQVLAQIASGSIVNANGVRAAFAAI